MSREERRQYQRQMKSMERGPALPPAARVRAERKAARRAGRGEQRSHAFTIAYFVRTALIALAVGFLVFSLQWGEGMPRALYVGLIAGAVAFTLLLALRFVQRRATGRS